MPVLRLVPILRYVLIFLPSFFFTPAKIQICCPQVMLMWCHIYISTFPVPSQIWLLCNGQSLVLYRGHFFDVIWRKFWPQLSEIKKCNDFFNMVDSVRWFKFVIDYQWTPKLMNLIPILKKLNYAWVEEPNFPFCVLRGVVPEFRQTPKFWVLLRIQSFSYIHSKLSPKSGASRLLHSDQLAPYFKGLPLNKVFLIRLPLICPLKSQKKSNFSIKIMIQRQNGFFCEMQVRDFQVLMVVFLLITPKMFQDFERYLHYNPVFRSYTGFFSKCPFS